MIFNYNLQPAGSSTAAANPSAQQSSTVEGLWWKQEPNVIGFVSLSNPSAQTISATVQVSDDQANVLGAHTVQVSGHGTKIIDLEEIQTAQSSAGGVRISYPGRQESLLTHGGLKDPATGFSASLPLHFPPVPVKQGPSSYAAIGMMTGEADPMMLFPAEAPGTVVVVTISIKSSDAAASGNSARDAYHSAEGTYSLGKFVNSSGGYCTIGYEADGAVTPSSYTGTVILVRTKGGVNYSGSTGQTVYSTYPTGTDDTSNPELEDQDPQSGGSNGVVYDLDAPAVQPATNEVWRKRVNYFENAQLPDGTYVANEVGFYVRISCLWGSSGNTFATDVSGDNVLTLGSTATSWNLQ